MARMGRKTKQLSFAQRRRADGKARRKPGPKPGKNALLPHVARPAHQRSNPVHVTLRAIAGLASFRMQLTYAAFERSVRDTRREDFRIAEFSVQVDHVHLVVEADDKEALARGMKSFSVRANRLFNAATGRGRGRVWRERYSRTDLTTPRQVRNALVYCLQNGRKHGAVRSGSKLVIDACSSARWFGGWALPRSIVETGPPPTAAPKTALLRYLWKKHGLIDPHERPAHAGISRRRSPSVSRWQ